MDIREVLQALDAKDRQLWSECRTAMRKVYLTAHNKVIGLADYEAQDDAFMDLIDIQLALLFDRGGRVNSAKTLSGDDGEKIKADLINKDDELKKTLNMHAPNDHIGIAFVDLPDTKIPNNEWK